MPGKKKKPPKRIREASADSDGTESQLGMTHEDTMSRRQARGWTKKGKQENGTNETLEWAETEG